MKRNTVTLFIFMLDLLFMNYILRIMSIIVLLSFNTNTFALEGINKVNKDDKDIFKTLTRKSLTRQETLRFLAEYIIIIDDKKGDGVVTYYFEDNTYKRYKKLKIISEDKWKISRFGYLKIFYNDKMNTWKIQPAKKNTINVKKKITSIGKLYDFVYEDKSNYYLKLVEKKLNDSNN